MLKFIVPVQTGVKILKCHLWRYSKLFQLKQMDTLSIGNELYSLFKHQWFITPDNMVTYIPEEKYYLVMIFMGNIMPQQKSRSDSGNDLATIIHEA